MSRISVFNWTRVGCAAVFGTTILFGCKSLEVREFSYQDYSSAVDAKDVSGLWIPKILPKSATEIHVRFDTDNGETWIAFQFGDDFLIALEQLQRVSRASQIDLDLHRIEGVAWWPRELLKESLHESSRPELFEIYSGLHEQRNRGGTKFLSREWVAIDREKHRAYYWRGEVERIIN